MSKHRWHSGLSAGLAIWLVAASTTLANEFAFSGVSAGGYDGFQGNQGIRTDPPAVSGVSYIHQVQAQMVAVNDFVAIGTYKGAGTTDGTVNCGAHYEPANWTGYYDREINGVYLCQSFATDFWLAGDNPSFRIAYAFCVAVGGNRWVMTFAGGQRTCISGPSSALILAAGLETKGSTTDRNIDVKYTNLQKNLAGSTTWSSLGDTRSNAYTDDFYSYSYVSTTAFNVYLAPLE